MPTSQKIGIYAGAFDPIHQGHVAFAEAALKACDLDKIIFLPERQPRGKAEAAPFEHRVAMVRLATQEYPEFEVRELDSGQFSVKYTLPELQAMFPGPRLTLLVGSDNVRAMNPKTWPNVENLYQTTNIAIGMRQGDDRAGLQHVAEQATVTYVYTDYPHAASTHVRGGDTELVSAPVREYIQSNNLYIASEPMSRKK